MFEFEQAAVEELLTNDDQFRRLFDKHRNLNAQIDEANAGNTAMDHSELGILKKEKLMLRDRMQAMIQAHAPDN
jgi:uncharacterized protein YdcH (DUF465 family)